MAIISLRAYNREIEGMIDNGQLDEAVAHCRHILATFPKYIASYRLLGKIHLEQQRISDATDIFQRVLSTIPDDFIANVGMSIIREDENNLDAAIWHMELAYEAQPANIAIQDELRRLYGRRDGTQPVKVRLTRGALARMYAKGGLFDQAIAELRAAIAEDPNRPDLQLLLAQMLYQTSQRIEAVEICVNILKKIPYCLEANRILAISLPDAETSDAVKNYRQIVISMDPYYAFAEPDAISSDQVAENVVNIEKLEWKSGIQAAEPTNQPTWATSLGISIDKSTEDKIPDWLKSSEAPPPGQPGEISASNVSPFIWDTQEVEKIITDTSKPEGEIPDWMKDAGWKPSTGEVVEAQEETKPEELGAEAPVDEKLEKAEIPEWLRGIAPREVLGEENQATPPLEEEISTPWLEPHQPGPTDSIIEWLEEKKPTLPHIPPTKEETFTLEPEEEMPDWLKNLDIPQPAATPGELPTTPTAAFTMEPSAFTKEPTMPESSKAVTPPSIEASGLILEAGLAHEETILPSEISKSEEPPTVPAEEVPDWLKEIAVEKPTEIPSEVELTQTEEVHQPEVIAPLETPAKVAEEIPDWLKEMATELPFPATEVPGSQEVLVETPAVAEPEITTEQPPSSEALMVEETSIPAEGVSEQGLPKAFEETLLTDVTSHAEELPTREFEPATQEVTSQELPKIAEPQAEEALPVPLGELPVVENPPISEEPPAEVQPSLEEASPPVEKIMGSTETPSIEQVPPIEAEAFTWLEGLAAEQETKSEELIAPPAEGEISPPEWVKLEIEPTVEESSGVLPPVIEEPPTVPAEAIPEWIKGLGEEPEKEPEAEVPTTEAGPEIEAPLPEELPSWLSEMEQPEVAVEAPITPEETLEWGTEEIPAWLKEITEGEEPGEITAPKGIPAPIEALPPVEVPAPQEAQAHIEVPHVEEIPPALIEVTTQPPEEIAVPAQALEQVAEVTQPEAEVWVPEIEQPVLPVTPAPTETTAEPKPVTEEMATQAVVISPAGPITHPEIPVEITPNAQASILTDAHQAVDEQNPSKAAELYTGLVKQNYHLDGIIKDLKEALYRFPVDINLWITLGDAHYHNDDLQQALNAYTKAEELVR